MSDSLKPFVPTYKGVVTVDTKRILLKIIKCFAKALPSNEDKFVW